MTEFNTKEAKRTISQCKAWLRHNIETRPDKIHFVLVEAEPDFSKYTSHDRLFALDPVVKYDDGVFLYKDREFTLVYETLIDGDSKEARAFLGTHSDRVDNEIWDLVGELLNKVEAFIEDHHEELEQVIEEPDKLVSEFERYVNDADWEWPPKEYFQNVPDDPEDFENPEEYLGPFVRAINVSNVVSNTLKVMDEVYSYSTGYFNNPEGVSRAASPFTDVVYTLKEEMSIAYFDDDNELAFLGYWASAAVVLSAMMPIIHFSDITDYMVQPSYLSNRHYVKLLSYVHNVVYDSETFEHIPISDDLDIRLDRQYDAVSEAFDLYLKEAASYVFNDIAYAAITNLYDRLKTLGVPQSVLKSYENTFSDYL